MVRKLSAIAIATLLMAFWTLGQSTIVGIVKDPGQMAVAGAQLTLTSLEDRSEGKAGTDSDWRL